MRPCWSTALMVVVTGFLSIASAQAADITFLCAAALQPAMDEVIPAFHAESGRSVGVKFANISVNTASVRGGDSELYGFCGGDSRHSKGPDRRKGVPRIRRFATGGRRFQVEGAGISWFAMRRSNPVLSCCFWIASRSLSSGAHSRDPLARND